MAKGWINGDESAKQMLGRVLKERPLLLLPHPLHRIPLGVSNIVEIAGPSPSAKTEILLQVAVSCILPKNRNGVQYGGLEHSVLFLDLDCRLDIFRLSQSLKLRIAEANRLHKITKKQKAVDVCNYISEHQCEYDDMDLFTECMKRFSYTRCYDSFEFLAALKVLRYKLEKERKADGSGVHVLMIDNIGAFHWIDRGFSSLPQGNPNRKNLSLQSVLETVVQEIKKLLLLHPMLVLATKTVTNQVKSSYCNWASGAASEAIIGKGWSKNTYREYMPSIWQSFVTHRILVRASNDERKLQDRDCYLAEWLLPALNRSDEFAVGQVTKVVPALTEEVKDALVKNIRRRMNPQPLKFRADIEMKCFQFDGVLHIKDAMRKAEAAGNQDCPVKIKLVAPPSYVLITQTLDKFCLIQIQPMKNKLREAMIAFGLLVEAKVIMDRATQRSKWFAFVMFAAIDELSGFGQSYLVKRVDSSPAFVRQRHRATRVQGIRPEFAAILV